MIDNADEKSIGVTAFKSRCLALIDEVAEGRTCVVLIGGEPGVGKTRLAAEATRRYANSAVAVWGRCHEDVGMPALGGA